MLDSLNLLPGRFRIVRYDIRGYGRSPAPVAAFTQLADLIAVLDYLDVAQAALVAHSGGGGPAIGLALAQPARVGPLILAAPGIRDYPWPPEDPYGAEIRQAVQCGRQGRPGGAGLADVGRSGRGSVRSGSGPRRCRRIFRQGEFERPDPPAYSRLGGIRASSVLAIGELDYAMVRDAAAHIAGRIPGCRRVVVPGADHLLPLRAPALLADLISKYVR